jgi:nonsense-mediated mRNA decay protein 3
MFCPECGSTDKKMIDNLCIDCFLKDFHMMTIPDTIEVEICSHCNGKLEEGKWKDIEIPQEEIIYRALENNIKIDDLVEDEEIELEIIQMRGTIAECYVEIIGKVYGNALQENHDVNVRLNKTVCPNCSKRNSGYYEAVIQFRADEREIAPEEFKIADEIVLNALNKLFEKDKLAYLVQIAKPKEGHDYYIGSYKSSKKVVKALQEEFGGLIKESPRLISEDKSTGKGLYRIWISLRIPKFRIGDFIRYDNKIGEIKHISSSKIQFLELENHKILSVQWNKYDHIELVKHKEDIEKTNIISKSPSIIQILDPTTYEVVDLKMNKELEGLNIGDDVYIIKIENQIYILAKKL